MISAAACLCTYSPQLSPPASPPHSAAPSDIHDPPALSVVHPPPPPLPPSSPTPLTMLFPNPPHINLTTWSCRLA